MFEKHFHETISFTHDNESRQRSSIEFQWHIQRSIIIGYRKELEQCFRCKTRTSNWIYELQRLSIAQNFDCLCPAPILSMGAISAVSALSADRKVECFTFITFDDITVLKSSMGLSIVNTVVKWIQYWKSSLEL